MYDNRKNYMILRDAKKFHYVLTVVKWIALSKLK